MSVKDQINALHEERNKAIEEERRILNEVKPGDVRTAEQEQALAAIDAKVRDNDKQVRDLIEREQRESEAAELRNQSERMFGAAYVKRDEQQVQSFLAWYDTPEHERSDFEFDITNALRERGMLRQGKSMDEIRNALYSDTGSIGSAVPTTMARSLAEYMEASIAMYELGVTMAPTSTGEPIQWPKLTAHAIGTQIIAQGTAIGGTDPTFDRVTTTPKRFGQLAKIGNKTLRDVVFPVEAFIGRDIGRGLGRLIDAFIVSGAATNPIVYSSLGTAALGGTIETLYTSLPFFIDAQYSINNEYRRNAKWLVLDKTAGAMRKIRLDGGGTVGEFAWERSLVAGTPDRFLGSPVVTDPNVASLASNATVGVYGDYSAYYMHTVGNVVIDSSTERFFDTDETGFRGRWEADGAWIDTTAAVTLRNRLT